MRRFFDFSKISFRNFCEGAFRNFFRNLCEFPHAKYPPYFSTRDLYEISSRSSSDFLRKQKLAPFEVHPMIPSETPSRIQQEKIARIPPKFLLQKCFLEFFIKDILQKYLRELLQKKNQIIFWSFGKIINAILG